MNDHQLKQRGERRKRMTSVTPGSTARLSGIPDLKPAASGLQLSMFSPLLEDTSKQGNDDKVKFLKFHCDFAD